MWPRRTCEQQCFMELLPLSLPLILLPAPLTINDYSSHIGILQRYCWCDLLTPGPQHDEKKLNQSSHSWYPKRTPQGSGDKSMETVSKAVKSNKKDYTIIPKSYGVPTIRMHRGIWMQPLLQHRLCHCHCRGVIRQTTNWTQTQTWRLGGWSTRCREGLWTPTHTSWGNPYLHCICAFSTRSIRQTESGSLVKVGFAENPWTHHCRGESGKRHWGQTTPTDVRGSILDFPTGQSQQSLQWGFWKSSKTKHCENRGSPGACWG